MKFYKKMYAIILTATLLMSIGAIHSFAENNHNDTNFAFAFPIGTSIEYTNARLKTDATSSYMKLEDIGGGYNSSYVASVVDSDFTNFSKTWYQTFDSSDLYEGRYLYNYAFEDEGRTYVRIKAVSRDGHGIYADGLWSPDSI